ncbi:MAG: 5-(carboxyamino)imidazole ribonucleotide synthase [Sphingomicrobium sp.]
MTIPPGSTIGIIGGGQLGRMLSIAAAQLGYDCHILDPHEAPAAARVAAAFTRARFDDVDALNRLADACDIVTYEFENLSAEPLRAIEDKLRPGVRSLAIGQDRALEKRFVEECGASPAPWRQIDSAADIVAALETLGAPVLIKTRRMGYDGKGQSWVTSPDEAEQAWAKIKGAPAVAEAKIDFLAEFSVIIARGADGETRAFPVPRNTHRDGILRHSEVPAGAAVEAQAAEGCAVAARIVERLGHVGVLTVELFATANGPLVNEFAPRVHNSGHWTIEGAETSQFEQHIRAICGLPLGSTALTGTGATMDNLIGNDIAEWPALVAEPGTHVHLYGKGEARPGRKVGHVTRVIRA